MTGSSDSEVRNMIDRLCAEQTKPEVLNALHACRPEHPWNKTIVKPFNNAYFLVVQQPYWRDHAAVGWLLAQCWVEDEEHLALAKSKGIAHL